MGKTLVSIFPLRALCLDQSEIVPVTLHVRGSFNCALQVLRGFFVVAVFEVEVAEIVKILGVTVVSFQSLLKRLESTIAHALGFVRNAEQVVGFVELRITCRGR